jgi:TolA-binding protein
MFFALLTLISALGISAVAAWYSIIGLSTLFSGAVTAIIIMGVALEVGKLVSASWLYRNWQICNFFLRYYLLFAIMVLVLVTSMGIFGFLSKAHLDQVRPTSRNTEKIVAVDEKVIQLNVRVDREKIKIARAENNLRQLDKAIDAYQGKNRISKSLKVRKKQSFERKEISTIIDVSEQEIIQINDRIEKLLDDKAGYKLSIIKTQTDVGPLRYVAELIYGEEEAEKHFDKAVRIVIITLIFVFDPLAVLMLIAANISFAHRRASKSAHLKKNEIIEELPTKKKNLTSKSGNDIIVDNKGIPTEIKKEVKAEYQQFPTFLKSEKPDSTLRKMVKDVDREYRPKVNTKSTIRKLFNKEQNYRDFINKIGKHDLKGLSDDEIAVKLDQIMDWNNKKIT